MPLAKLIKTSIEVEGKFIPAKIYLERRSSIRFYIGKNGAILRMPHTLPAERRAHEEERFRRWVCKKVACYDDQNGTGHAFGKTYVNGDELIVGKRTYRLNIIETTNKTHSGRMYGKNIIQLRLSGNDRPETRHKATRHLLSRLVAQDFHPEIYRRVMELNEKYFNKKVNSVNLKFNRSNWGSCSTRGNINLSTCLLFAPDDVIDYVIIHELAHLVEMNHSPRFWALVEKAMPDYDEKRKWLKDNWQVCNF